VRRRSQLLSARDDVEVVELRGNVDTRLRRLADGDFDAIVLAAAGLARLGRHGEGAGVDVDAMTPSPGQGCLALEIRAGDDEARRAVEAITDPLAQICLHAERECVVALDATCDTPVGAYAECIDGDPKRLRMRAYVGAPDGSVWIRDTVEGGPDVGRVMADRLLSAGAAGVLAGPA
jgi:hydroxymethylbilane synthase